VNKRARVMRARTVQQEISKKVEFHIYLQTNNREPTERASR
jgi:hypothetical protein